MLVIQVSDPDHAARDTKFGHRSDSSDISESCDVHCLPPFKRLIEWETDYSIARKYGICQVFDSRDIFYNSVNPTALRLENDLKWGNLVWLVIEKVKMPWRMRTRRKTRTVRIGSKKDGETVGGKGAMPSGF